MERKYYIGEQILEALSEVGVGARDTSEVLSYLGRLPSVEPEWQEFHKNALCIRKTDAIKICMEQIESPIGTYFEKGTAAIIKKKITELPSAEPEIIKCGECKWYGRTDKRRFYRGMDCLNKHIDTIVPNRDFCSRAERRANEPNRQQ